jgi:uncharacterized protein YpmB
MYPHGPVQKQSSQRCFYAPVMQSSVEGQEKAKARLLIWVCGDDKKVFVN